MLELPEVEVLRRDLEKEVVGKRVKDVIVQTPSVVRPFHRTRPEFVAALEERKIEGARRRGRVILLDLDEELTWVVRAHGTASVHRETANEDPGPNTHLVVTFTIGGAIHVSDADGDEPGLSTGVVATQEALEAAGVPTTGYDPLEDNLTWMEFGRMLQDASAPLRLLMEDQSVLLGFGPVYADEILYEAGLRYDRPSDRLSTQEVRRLYRAMHEVINAAMKFRGSSLDDDSHDEIVDEDGEAAEHLKVYGRAGQPSFRTRKPVAKTTFKGVTTYYDPQSQV